MLNDGGCVIFGKILGCGPEHRNTLLVQVRLVSAHFVVKLYEVFVLFA